MQAPIIGIERHRLTTDGEGVTTLVAFHGCPLHCRYCLNPQCLDRNWVCRVITPEELLSEVMIDDLYFTATGGGITFGGGEPLQRSGFISEFCRLKKAEWSIDIETSLNVSSSHLEQVLPFVRQLIVDVKDLNDGVYQAYTGQTNAQAVDNLRLLSSLSLQKKILIRLPLIPGYNDEERRQESKTILEGMGFNHFDEFTYIIK